MVQRVRKRDGSVEPFSAEKLIRSVTRTGANEALARKIAEDARTSPDLKEETSSADLRAFVLIRLQKEDIALDHAWRQHEFETKGRSRAGRP